MRLNNHLTVVDSKYSRNTALVREVDPLQYLDTVDIADAGVLRQSLESALLELDVQDSELTLYRSELSRLRTEILKYKDIFESAPIGYFTLDPFLQIIEVNAAGAEILGKRLKQVINTPFGIYLSNEEREALVSHVNTVIAGKSAKIKTNVICSDGSAVSVTLYSHPVRLSDKKGYCCQSAMMDISEHSATETQLRKAKDYLQHVATTDPLTKLPNRLYFNDQLGASLLRARRSGKKVAVLLMDLDRFKNVNDTLGHQVGDELLVEVAKRLKHAVRSFDTVARLGGDEFTVILEKISNTNEVSEIARSISRELAKPFVMGSHEVCTAASMGVCVYPSDSLNTDEMVRFADAAMYRAKSLGRNNIQFFTTDLNAELFRRFTLENDLRFALRENQFELMFQPQYDVKKKEVVGMEALLRWNHPTRGQLSPDEFIDIAEETGVIETVGDWVLSRACECLSELREQGHTGLRVSVNLSARQFSQANLHQTIVDILERTKLPPSALELELTESALLEDAGHSIDTLKTLREIGVELSIDDFGTGYSSLSRLRRLPLSRIKIDKSFVFGLPSNQDDRSITQAIVSMAHDLGLEVVSEGVETKAQAIFLEQINCDLLQGYFLGRPMPFKKFSQQVTDGSIAKKCANLSVAKTATDRG